MFELVHSEDREELQRQLHWNSFLTPDQAAIPLQVLLHFFQGSSLFPQMALTVRSLVPKVILNVTLNICYFHSQLAKYQSAWVAIFIQKYFQMNRNCPLIIFLPIPNY